MREVGDDLVFVVWGGVVGGRGEERFGRYLGIFVVGEGGLCWRG